MIAALALVTPVAVALHPVLQTYLDAIACDAHSDWTDGTLAWPAHFDSRDLTGYEMSANKLHITAAIDVRADDVEALQQALLLRDAIAEKLHVAELDYVALVSRHLWRDEPRDDNDPLDVEGCDSLVVWFWIVRKPRDAIVDAAGFAQQAVSIVFRLR
jgi:hypothetical protein